MLPPICRHTNTKPDMGWKYSLVLKYGFKLFLLWVAQIKRFENKSAATETNVDLGSF